MTVITTDPDAALAGLQDGATVLIGGFGPAGQPVELIDALLRTDVGDLTVVNNNAGNGTIGLAALLAAGRVRKIICSFPRQSDSFVFDELYRAGRIELELVPQGNLAERIRAAGAGIGAFYTPTGVGTPLAEGKEVRRIDGRDYVMELPLRGDVALVKALTADTWGNLVYRKTARNFGPIMARRGHHHDRAGRLGGAGRRPRPRGRRDPRHLRRPRPRPLRRHEGAVRMTITHTTVVHDRAPLSRDELAEVVARDIAPDSYVNLGIGQPTKVSDYLPADSGIVLHTENGMLGMGPEATGDEIDEDLLNAGKIPVTELAGASYFHHADSFAMMRGGHLDVCVLGAFQVSGSGDLANWSTGEPGSIPAVGGAMDLALGAKQTFVMMNLFTRDGSPKLVPSCTYPLTGVGCVTRLYADHGVFLLGPDGVRVRELFGITVEELVSRLDVPLLDADGTPLG